MISKYKKNNRFIFGLIIGVLVSTVGVYATVKLSSSDILYDNSKSGGSSSDVQGAIEELYEKSSKCTTGPCSLTKSNFVIGYIYNQEGGAANYCVTGNEVTCERTDCYTSSSKTCPSGTIIDYIVSGDKNNKVRFHVMYDKGRKIVMQSQKNIVRNIKWYTANDTTKGPLTILSQLEKATESWSNVENQTYTMGTTIFQDNQWTGCSSYNTCTTNIYTLAERTEKARMITVQEATNFGCTNSYSSCPIWMYNYLYDNIKYGATINDNSVDPTTKSYNYGYWLMNASTDQQSYLLWGVGSIAKNSPTIVYDGARAVIEVFK